MKKKFRMSARVAYIGFAMIRFCEKGMAGLASRYPEFQGQEEPLEEALRYIVELRQEVAEGEDPRFDDAQVSGLRFFKAYSKYARVNRAPSSIQVLDEQKGVLQFFGVPFKVYGAVSGVGPRRNKMAVGPLEAAAAYQTTLGSIVPEFDADMPPVKHVLLRVEVDDGMPQRVSWEEYRDDGLMCWSVSLAAEDDGSAATPVVLVTPSQPPPTHPSRQPVLPPGGGVLETGADGDEHDFD